MKRPYDDFVKGADHLSPESELLKSDLKRLAESVPECRVTFGQIQHALGRTPAKRRITWAWALAPLAAACLALFWAQPTPVAEEPAGWTFNLPVQVESPTPTASEVPAPETLAVPKPEPKPEVRPARKAKRERAKRSRTMLARRQAAPETATKPVITAVIITNTTSTDGVSPATEVQNGDDVVVGG